jgi:hypothetical protein
MIKNPMGANIEGIVPIKNEAPVNIKSIPRYIGFLEYLYTPRVTINDDFAVGHTAVSDFLNCNHAHVITVKPKIMLKVAINLYGICNSVSGGEKNHSPMEIVIKAIAILGGLYVSNLLISYLLIWLMCRTFKPDESPAHSFVICFYASTSLQKFE